MMMMTAKAQGFWLRVSPDVMDSGGKVVVLMQCHDAPPLMGQHCDRALRAGLRVGLVFSRPCVPNLFRRFPRLS